MGGADVQQDGMFSYISLESRVPASHPLRGIKVLLDEALKSMSRDVERVYAREGRPSIPPERLVRASALQVLYSIRSERLLCEQLDYNLLFHWFVGFSADEPIWDHSTFTKNRDRLIAAAVKSMRRRDGSDDPPGPGRNATVNWHGEKRSNETHVSPQDPQAKLFTKGDRQAGKLSHMGHALLAYRHGLIVDVEATEANCYAERQAALKMIDRQPSRA
jgi:transposase